MSPNEVLNGCGPGTTNTNDLQHITSQLCIGNSACQYVTRWCQLLLFVQTCVLP